MYEMNLQLFAEPGASGQHDHSGDQLRNGGVYQYVANNRYSHLGVSWSFDQEHGAGAERGAVSGKLL